MNKMQKAAQNLSSILAMLALVCVSLVSFTACNDNEPVAEVTYSWEFEEVSPSTPDFIDDKNKIESTFKAALGASGTATSVTKQGTSETCDQEVLEVCQRAFDSLKDEVWQGRYVFVVTNTTTGTTICKASFSADNDNELNPFVTIYKASDLKFGDYYYSDGTWSDGGLRKLYSDGTTKSEETTPPPVTGKTCIGIVFYVGHHPADQSNYMSTGIGREKCNGYVVALQDATDSRIVWGDSRKELGCYPTDADGNKQNNYDNPDSDWCGYAWTQKIITAVGGKDNLDDMISPGYPATWYAVVSYETGCKAPSNSSGWFLPSIGQMWKIYQNRSTLFDSKSVGTGLKSGYNVGYWSSSEFSYSPVRLALNVHADRAKVFNNVKDVVYYYTVRPILAF